MTLSSLSPQTFLQGRAGVTDTELYNFSDPQEMLFILCMF